MSGSHTNRSTGVGDAPLVFSHDLVAWQQVHGRHHLPWQKDRDPYKVWLSEVMLQQTQVVTVVAYFERFLSRFPDVHALAQAPQDEVLGLWSGLGYYSRARNLHRCAQQVVSQWQGRFPPTVEQLQTLPGIGRSTAAAIAATCFGLRVSILDGNAKRVIARYLGFTDNIAEPVHEKKLWEQAATLLPTITPDAHNPMPAYTQGLMDLGATLCTPKSPRCTECPVQQGCQANRLQLQTQLPLKKKQLKRTHANYWLLCVSSMVQGVRCVFWLRRPNKGIWAGLLCLPLYHSEDEMRLQVEPASQSQLVPMVSLNHALTHKDLRLHFVSVTLPWAKAQRWSEGQNGQWLAQDQWQAEGVPAPVRRVMQDHPTPGGA